MARVLIAPDSFKGTASAGDELVLAPQADGGEGTVDAIAATDPTARVLTTRVTGPDGRPVDARWLLRSGGEAVVELAESSGLPLMATLDALGAHTRGLGEVIAAALDAGATSLTIGLGGSASTDGGAGALRALGLGLFDVAGSPLAEGGAALAHLVRVDTSGLRPPPPGGVRLLTDVTAPLLGPDGAAAIFGPQKGATPQDVVTLDAALERFAHLLPGDPQQPGSGAAGGTAFGFAAAWGGIVVAGAPAIAELSGLVNLAAAADVVISGEGRFDATSSGGKVVGHVLSLVPPAARAIVVAGTIAATPTLPGGHPVIAVALDRLAPSSAAAQTDALHWLQVAGARAADEFTAVS